VLDVGVLDVGVLDVGVLDVGVLDVGEIRAGVIDACAMRRPCALTGWRTIESSGCAHQAGPLTIPVISDPEHSPST